MLKVEYYSTDPISYRYRLVRCAACQDLSLLMAEYVGESYESQDDYGYETAVYPAPPTAISEAVPKALRDVIIEARTCYQARAYTASAIMCRRAIESLAKVQGATARNLATAIKELQSNGTIDQRLFDWCDELRLAGNGAAHDVETSVNQADARDMNDLTEAIVDYVYVFQGRYQSFKDRRTASSNT